MGIEWLVYVVPSFADDLRGSTAIGIIDHQQDKKTKNKYSLPVTHLIAHEDPNDAARRALYEHTGATVAMDHTGLTLLAATHSNSPLIGDSYALSFVAHEPKSGWPTDRMKKVPTSLLPLPDDCPPYMRALLARFCIYDTNLGAKTFTHWPDAWRMLAQETYSAIDPHQRLSER